MTSIKLIFRNVRKNIQDYAIYFLTLMISVSLFYSFNSIQSQPALNNLNATKQLLSEQLGILISGLSVIVAIVLAFLILYANQFLLKRRKKELGLYLLMGMEKGKISRIFAGETLCIGVLSLICGLIFGVLLSQGLSLLSLKLFAVNLEEFQIIFSIDALKMTIKCFVIIFLVVVIFNVSTISKVKLIDLFTASRKNEEGFIPNKIWQGVIFAFAIACIGTSGWIFHKYGILPSKENSRFQIATILLITGTILFFYSGASVLLSIMRAHDGIYLKGLNAFFSRQIGSKIRTNYLSMSIVCGLLTIAICGVSVGISSAIAMNKASKAALPFDLNVVADINIAGDTDIANYLQSKGVDIGTYASKNTQISVYESDSTYGKLFEDQDVKLWSIDKDIPECNVLVISESDFNKAMEIQGKDSVELKDDEFLLNCNYEGTQEYIKTFLQKNKSLKIAGKTLRAASNNILQETWWMTSVGNNDRGTIIVSDALVDKLKKYENVLLVQYNNPGVSDEVIQKMIPIGLESDTYGYRYSEKNMMNGMYYGSCALLVFLCCYIGVIFLLICAALLSLKQLTETADNVYRYGLLQKLGTDSEMLFSVLFKQIAVFFVIPLMVAGIYSILGIKEALVIAEGFLNIHISANVGVTLIMFVLIYGGYLMTTYFSCKHMVQEKNLKREMEE